MRLKIRGPSGTTVLTLADDATVATLLADIAKDTSADAGSGIDIKFGYPPKPLDLSGYPPSTPLADLPVKLQGEQLIVSRSGSSSVLRGVVKSGSGTSSPVPTPAPEAKTGIYPAAQNGAGGSGGGSGAPFSFTDGSVNRTEAVENPVRLARAQRINKDDPPDVRLGSARGTVVLRVMEDDNCCLFRALSYVMTRSMMSVEELRQLVAGTIQGNRDKYSAAVLEQDPDGYCEWIKMESSWGGGIELAILAEFFDMEICTIDVATGNMIGFNEGKPRRVVVVYSGIHYDALALSPAGALLMDSERDELVFEKDDEEILAAAQELCTKLRAKHYFTDTKNFAVRCNVCKQGMKGEMEAMEHAKATGHSDFGEA